MYTCTFKLYYSSLANFHNIAFTTFLYENGRLYGSVHSISNVHLHSILTGKSGTVTREMIVDYSKMTKNDSVERVNYEKRKRKKSKSICLKSSYI